MFHHKEGHIAFDSISRRFSSDVLRIIKEIFGGESQSVLEALTKPVGTYYVRCNTYKISPQELKGRLERKDLQVGQHPIIPEALGIRMKGRFDIPSADQKIVVDKRTAEAVLQGANVYAPGILRCESIHPGDDLTIESELGDVIGTGKALMSTNDVLTFRKGLAVRVDHHRFEGPRIRELIEFSEGLLYPQSLPAMITSRILDPQPGEIIVDMNCAPGGKISHLSQLMQNSGKIFGFDRNKHKIDRTRRTLVHLGCANVILSVQDTRYLHTDMPSLKADRTLIDPPCSALGLRPKVYDFTTQEVVNNLAEYQKQFLKAASNVTKPGGTIVYSVCTFTKQEGEQIVEYAERECGLQVVEQKPLIGSKGLSEFGNSGLLCQRFHPHVNEIGFFIARFQR